MKVGQVISGTVKRILKTHFIVDMGNDFHGLVHVSEISDYYVANIESMFTIDYEYDFLIVDIDDTNKRVKLSWKKIVPRFQKDPFHFNIKETKSGFKNLQAKTIEKVKND